MKNDKGSAQRSLCYMYINTKTLQFGLVMCAKKMV